MSARHFYSAREKNVNKLIDCLPDINQQKFGYNLRTELPALSANTSSVVNRNLNYSFDIQSFGGDSVERTGTPFSDFFSESDTATPDFRSEESDSSSGSALRRNTAEASKTLADEWGRIERTLYDEEGEKSSRPQIIEECKQWRQLHPQLRIIGKAIQLPEKRLCYRQIEHDEVIAIHYSDYEQFSESEERLSQSSSDVTPQNSPRVSIAEDLHEPKLSREKVTFYPAFDEDANLPDTFCSLLQITPIQIRSPSHKKRQGTSILRSELASSKWMRNSRPDSSLNCDRNSAKSFVSLDTRNYTNALSASERNKYLNGRVVTARHRDLTRLEPLCTPDVSQNEVARLPNGLGQQYSIRKVSLPPLLLEEERRKVHPVSSAKKISNKPRKSIPKGMYQFDRVSKLN
ncbi:uncharacterized protein LOC114352381 [Ostrinia furnacalis]|uniref:uncharacterized protein LOC114352381 n=1 Tax=Ostrinia furnacalis TaxID=93504 RepID=UPI0010388863|nr:uncharacterized protein LOC114352381 [Ostrinia furnacalis]